MSEKIECIDPRPYAEISFQILSQLCDLYEEGNDIEKFFLDNTISKIAIYGAGNIGRHFYRSLRGSQVDVLYFIDQNADGEVYEMVDVYLPEEAPNTVDAVVVTPVKFFYEIESKLNVLIPDTYIISAETVVNYRRSK